ncbi:hypothetical protein PanWU01x14_277810 [Parasponia andersonii]|uniref:Uncharacterized protein n=1 Tax=Parasponia andersonii TaxID=3476 RepID=A0A2P5B2K3_PARAD|nr:hypothetical protein PanWU01x14_277810 [Parasponia andersonii]
MNKPFRVYERKPFKNRPRVSPDIGFRQLSARMICGQVQILSSSRFSFVSVSEEEPWDDLTTINGGRALSEEPVLGFALPIVAKLP